MNQVTEAIRGEGGRIREIVLARSGQRVLELAEESGRRGIPVRYESRDTLAALVGHPRHQGVAALLEEFIYTPFDVLLSRPPGEIEPLVALDSIQDPQNFGAILRSSCFLGAKAVLIPKDRSVKVTDTVIRVAAGAAAHLPVVEVTNLVRAMEDLKKAGLWIAGLDVEGSRSIYEVDLSAPLALVVGNEQKGLRPLVRKQCDMLVRIPGHGPLESLNAATACAVAIAEAQRQRQTAR